MGLFVTTQPAIEPLTVEQVMLHLRVDTADEIPYLVDLIRAARQDVEMRLGRSLLTQSLTLTLDAFPGYGYWGHHGSIILPRPVLVSVTSVTYLDSTGVLTVMPTSDYQVISKSEPARIVPAYGLTWPTTRYQPEAVTIVYIAGWTSATLVPQPIKQAMLLLIGHMYENREAVTTGSAGVGTVLPMAVQSLLLPYTMLEAA